MKRGTVFALLASHGVALGIGWMIARSHRELPPLAGVPAAADERPAAPDPRATDREPNPILRASGKDFEAAWREMICRPRDGSGEPRISINFFLDWCHVDPEGAIVGLADLYAPRFAHNYLNNATQSDFGGDLAPALVKHWRELRYLPQYKVEFAMGHSLRRLAETDPARTADLVADLPPGVRQSVYRNLFDRLEARAIESLVESLVESLPSGDAEEREQLWASAAHSVRRHDPDAGLARLLKRARDPVATRAVLRESIESARRTESWEGFLNLVFQDGGEAAVRWIAPTREILGESMRADPELRSSLRKACEERGHADWIQALGPPPEP